MVPSQPTVEEPPARLRPRLAEDGDPPSAPGTARAAERCCCPCCPFPLCISFAYAVLLLLSVWYISGSGETENWAQFDGIRSWTASGTMVEQRVVAEKVAAIAGSDVRVKFGWGELLYGTTTQNAKAYCALTAEASNVTVPSGAGCYDADARELDFWFGDRRAICGGPHCPEARAPSLPRLRQEHPPHSARARACTGCRHTLPTARK